MATREHPHSGIFRGFVFAKADNDAKVDSSLPVNPRKKKKKKTPSARRRATRQQRFLEKKAAEKATSPKRFVSQATIPKELESVPKNWTFHRRSEIRKEPINLVESETSSETSNSAHLNNQRHRVLPFRLLYKRSRKFSRTSLQLILTETTILVTQEFVLTVTVNQKKGPCLRTVISGIQLPTDFSHLHSL